MKYIKTTFIFLFINCQFIVTQNFTFCEIQSDISTIGNNLAEHFSIGIGQTFGESQITSQSISLRFLYFQRPNYMDVRSTPLEGEFLLSNLTTKTLNISYGIKRKIVNKLFLTLNLDGGLVALNEEFRYWVKDGQNFDVLYNDDYKDSYKINLGYSLETGLEYFILGHDNYFISTSLSFQFMNRIRDFEFKDRDGEFNRYSPESSIVEPEKINQLPTDYFWLAGLSFGYNL